MNKGKAQRFYYEKETAKNKARTTKNSVAAEVDFRKNKYLPNVPTIDVYDSFTHLACLSFTLTLCSLPKNTPDDVKHLHISYDFAVGQNRNFILLKFMEDLVHKMKRF